MRKPFEYDPGFFSDKLKLQKPIETADNCGGLDVIWDDLAMLWANIKPVTARSNFMAHQDLEELSHEMIIRANPQIMSGWRFKKDERIFAIKSLYDPDENGRYLICNCWEQGR